MLIARQFSRTQDDGFFSDFCRTFVLLLDPNLPRRPFSQLHATESVMAGECEEGWPTGQIAAFGMIGLSGIAATIALIIGGLT